MGRYSKGTHVLRKVRERLSWLQKEMAHHANIPVRTIQDIERGPDTLKLSAANARKISAATGVSTDYLLANDPNREITNISGEPWSEKDLEAIKPRAEEWPGLSEMGIQLRAMFFSGLLSDYYILRRSLLATQRPLRALDSWREHREKAWVEFLKEWPAAKWESPYAIKPADFPTKANSLSGDRAVETAKQDAEFVLEHPFGPRTLPDPIFDILEAAYAGVPVESGDKVLDDFLESLSAQKRPQRSYTFDGYHDGAKSPPEAMQAVVDKALRLQRESGAKPHPRRGRADKEAQPE